MIRIFAMDVDGTLTDGKIHISEKGEMFKSFNVKDGLGIKILIENNILPVIITGRTSEIVLKRANELGITHVYQNIKDKKFFLEKMCEKLNVTFEQVAYIGDDLNDMEVLSSIEYSFVPGDAVEEVKTIAKYVCNKKGGEGAVREAIDKILKIIKEK